MQNIAIASLIILMSFMIANALVQHYQTMPQLRILHILKDSQKHKAFDWTPFLSLSNYSSSVASNVAKIDESSNLTALGELVIGEMSKFNYQLQNLHPDTNATSALQNFLKIYKKEKKGNTLMQAYSATDEKFNYVEASVPYHLMKEESSITYSANTGSRFRRLQLRHNRSNFLPSDNNNDNNINLVKISPNISFASNSFELESVTYSKLAAKFPEYSKRKRHLREKRAVASSANFCHFRHLHKCGEPVIRKFKLELDAATKCKIREDFLDCMVRQRKEGCFSSDDSLYTDENTGLLRSKIRTHLWSAHGCLLF